MLVLSMSFSTAFAQKKGKKGKKDDAKTTTAAKPPMAKKKGSKKKEKTIKDMVKKCQKFEGLFDMYQDTTNGSAFIQIHKDQLNKEFIYFSHIVDGPLSAGAFRGAYGTNNVFTIRKHYDRLELVTENNNFYFDEDNAISKAADANISDAILLSEKIVAKDSAKENYLIKADGLFLNEKIRMVNTTYLRRRGFKLGRLSKDKTKYAKMKNYPENTDVVVEYVYDNANPRGFAGSDVTDSRYVSIKAQHSFIEMPDNDYQPRWDDPRIGYFATQVNDMTATDATPFRDMIHRWHLVKKDKNAAISEPVEPITWWIENTTPVEFRDAIKEGVLAWNSAFEKAGFKNAMVVKVQPDDADWDAGDMRYNVLRWTSSPNPPFGGYGPSFVNPRTGQILGADIMLEYVHFTNRVKYTKLYEGAKVEHFSWDEVLEEDEHAAEKAFHNNRHFCSFSDFLQDNRMFGETILRADNKADLEMTKMKKEAMIELVMHEVGHTLGLMHNMKASQLYTPEQVNDMSVTSKTGLTASVMDYVVINVAKDRSKQGHYYSTAVGPYDDWAIEFGYKPDVSESDLMKLASKSASIPFGNDADDMRAPGKAIDPRVMIGDLSNDAVGYSIDRMELVLQMMKTIQQKYYEEGETYQELRTGFNILTGQYFNSNNVISRYIGGLYVDRSFQGQEGASMPFTPVSKEYQKKAMDALAKYAFAPNAFDIPKELYSYLQIQRRGFNLFASTEDYKIHNTVLAMQRGVLRHLLHPNTLTRIVDTQVYGNEYPIDQMMTDLNDAIFKADQYSNVNTFRQNLQLEYTKGLISMIGGKLSRFYPDQAKSMALYNLKKIEGIASNGRGDLQTKAHKEHLKLLISKALDTK